MPRSRKGRGGREGAGAEMVFGGGGDVWGKVKERCGKGLGGGIKNCRGGNNLLGSLKKMSGGLAPHVPPPNKSGVELWGGFSHGPGAPTPTAGMAIPAVGVGFFFEGGEIFFGEGIKKNFRGE